MIRHSPLLRGSPAQLRKGTGDHGHRSPPSLFWEGKGLRSWSYTFFFLEYHLLFRGREGMVAMVILSLLLSSSLPFWSDTTLCCKVILLSWEKERVIMALGLSLHLLGREGLVVMVIHICLLRIEYPLLRKGRGGGHGLTYLSS